MYAMVRCFGTQTCTANPTCQTVLDPKALHAVASKDLSCKVKTTLSR